MSISPYFSYTNATERKLYENIITESIHVMGQNVLYLPRTLVNVDQLFLEDILSNYQDSFLISVYQDSHNSGFGDTNTFGKFGIEVKDEAVYTVSKLEFERIVLNNDLDVSTRPLEGDLVYSMMSGMLFQIKFVENEDPYRMFGDVQTYKLYCESMKYSNQRITADIVEPESYEFSTTLLVTLLAGSGDFEVGTIVTNGTTTGKVIDWNLPLKALKLIDLNGKINKNLLISSGSTVYSIDNWKTVEDQSTVLDINAFLEKSATAIIVDPNANLLGAVVTENFMTNF
jgi:hypothetical protein